MSLRLTPLEEQWRVCVPMSRIETVRTVCYDPVYVMYHMQVSRRQVPIQTNNTAADLNDDVVDSFIATVKGEFGNDPERGMLPIDPKPVKRCSPDAVAGEYLSACDSLVFDGCLDYIYQDSTLNNDQKCFELLCSKEVGNPSNKKHLDESKITTAIANNRSEEKPLQFILPSFPFKDQNPFRTHASAHHVDLGEIAFIIRLHTLALALSKVYPFGVEWILINDGMVYSELFGTSSNAAAAYREGLREWRNRLNLQKTIHFVDFTDLLRLASPIGDPTFINSFRQEIEQRIKNATETRQDVTDALAVLERGIRWNLATRDLLQKWERNDLWSVLNNRSEDTIDNELVSEVDKRSQYAALKYASFNLAVGHVHLISSLFPSGFRSTVHPKSGQIGVPRLGEVYPWNGTAVLLSEHIGPNSIESRDVYKLDRDPRLEPYASHGSVEPFFYSVSSNKF